MSEMAVRWRRVAGGFTQRAREVPAGGWERPAPCDGWVARDVVGHMVEWMPAFLTAAGGPELRPGPSVDEDPVGAWLALDGGIQALLDDPVVAGGEISHPYAGTHALGDAVGMFFLGDVLVHTWDLARATGLDERLDPEEVGRMRRALEPLGDMLHASGQYGPRIEVPPGADGQIRMLALTGRRS